MKNDKTENNKKPEQIAIRRGRRKTKDYPAVSLQTALEICEAILKCGGAADSYGLIGDVLKIRGGALNNRITAARRYGLIEKDRLVNTDLASRILKPIEHNEDKNAQKEAILSVPLFNDILRKFGTILPENNIFANVLIRSYDVPEAAVGRVISMIRKNFELLGDNTDVAETMKLKPVPQLETVKNYIRKNSEYIKSNTPPFLIDSDRYIFIKDGQNIFTFVVDENTDWHLFNTTIDSLKKRSNKSPYVKGSEE